MCVDSNMLSGREGVLLIWPFQFTIKAGKKNISSTTTSNITFSSLFLLLSIKLANLSMAEALVSTLLEQFASIGVREAEQEIKLVVGVDTEVRKLEGNLRIIRAVLDDAEKRQLKDKAVKLWLKKFKDTSYEMDDVLDEWNTALIKSEIEKNEENAENEPIAKKRKG